MLLLLVVCDATSSGQKHILLVDVKRHINDIGSHWKSQSKIEKLNTSVKLASRLREHEVDPNALLTVKLIMLDIDSTSTLFRLLSSKPLFFLSN